jgi:hypothetical protein
MLWEVSEHIKNSFLRPNETLFVHKTGLPFYDTMRLYGAIELYLGLSHRVAIQDEGVRWRIDGIKNKLVLDNVVQTVTDKIINDGNNRAQKTDAIVEDLNHMLKNCFSQSLSKAQQNLSKAKKPIETPDPALQQGIRDDAALLYNDMKTSAPVKPYLPISDLVLVYAGQKRIEQSGAILFLPVFEGEIDLSRVISPLRIYIRRNKEYSPSLQCHHALVLLALKTSLFSDGYAARLSAVVYKTDFPGQRSDNRSGLVSIEPTVVGHSDNRECISAVYTALKNIMVETLINDQKKMVNEMIGIAQWVLEPSSQTVAPLITAQERFISVKKWRKYVFIHTAQIVKEVFTMSHNVKWEGRHYEAVKGFAQATSRAIWTARMSGANDKGKAWYGEVAALRNASSWDTFRHQVLTLMEQGKKENDWIGIRDKESWDPQILEESAKDFESFRDIFRMYLIQYRAEVSRPDDSTSELSQSEEITSDTEEDTNA